MGDALRFEDSATGRSYPGGCAQGNAAQERTTAGREAAASADPPAFPSAAFDGGELRRD